MDLKEAVKKISRLGHDGIHLDGSTTVCIDPFRISVARPADIILISHDHFDHNSPEDIAKIRKEDTVIVTEKESAKKLEGDVRVVKVGDKIEIKGVGIEIVPAYNTDKEFPPREAGMLGFLITLDGVRYYHAGDTDFIPEMKNLKNVDIAFLPVSGTYVMTADEAVQAARAIKPKIAIPMHYAEIVGFDDDAAKFQKALAGEIEVVILEKAKA